jgi:hypothetical protein
MRWGGLGLCRVLLTAAGGWGCRKANVAPARKLSKAIFWMLSTSRFYRKVEPCLAPQGQADSGPYYMANS